MVSIGIYPGTFDPVHAGHIAFAKRVLETCELDSVVFIPEEHPRNKSPVSSIHERADQINRRIDDERLSVLRLKTPRFTYSSTAAELSKVYPHETLSLLIGSDVALQLPKWKDLTDLFMEFKFIIATRDNVDEHEVLAVMNILADLGYKVRYDIINAPLPELSSSQLRQEI